LLSIPTGERYPALALTPQKQKEKTLQALIAQAEGLALRHPVLMIFEDVHWSDPTTRELLDLLVERVPKVRLLALITYRPEFSPAWVGRPQVTLMTLSRLPPRQRAEMISQMTGGKALPREITNQIAERTDGVPLFIKELTKAVIESGVVADAGDRYTVAGTAPSLAIPTSLHASLLARLDRLAPTREVAQIAASLGRSFSHDVISAVADMSGQVLDDALGQLVRAELVFRRGTPPDAEYTFKHALVRDAAYDTLLRSNRIRLHAHIASVLERDFPETIEASPEVLAQHYTSAGVAEQAVPYWLKAGRVALQKSHLAEAASSLRKGLELVPHLVDKNARVELELQLQAALAITLSGAVGLGKPEVEQTYLRARELCDEIGTAPQLFPVLYGLFAFHWSRADLKKALTNAEEMLGIATQAGDPSLMLIGHFSVGGVLWCVGRAERALDHLLQAQALYDEKAHAPIAYVYGEDFGVWTLGILATQQLSVGYPERASRNVRKALALARRLNHPLSACNALLFNSLNSYYLRDWISAQRLIDEAYHLAVEYGFAQYSASTAALRAHIFARLGSVKEGIDLAREGLAAWQAVGAAITLPFGLTALAESLIADGQVTAARDATDQALFWINKNGEHQSESYVYCCRGDIFRMMGEHERACAEYQIALEGARRQQTKFFELKAAMSMARLWRDQGKRAEARDLLAPVYGWFTEGFDTLDLKEAKALLEQLAS
jgi:tetratricopeptide (TPR) repeat protein